MSDAAGIPSTGLVLSGGGAKGAYQVGVLKALLELGASIDMVAGASMGALNGAVLACAPSLPEGVQRLETLWNTLASTSPVEANTPAYLKLLAAAGLALGAPLPGLLAQVPALAHGMRWAGPTMQIAGDWLESALLSDGPLKTLMNEYLDTDGLMRGLPLYVSVFESKGGLADLLRCAVAEAGLADTPPRALCMCNRCPHKSGATPCWHLPPFRCCTRHARLAMPAIRTADRAGGKRRRAIRRLRR